MTTPNIFAKHIGHRAILLDERHLRCHDCDHTLVIPSGAGSTSTSSRSIPNIDDPLACQLHAGEHAATCGPCRSERIAIPDGQTKTGHLPTGADPTDVAEWTEARKQLAHAHVEHVAVERDSKELALMAAARAELEQLRSRAADGVPAVDNDQDAGGTS